MTTFLCHVTTSFADHVISCFGTLTTDPGADREGKGKSKLEKKMATKKSIVGREEPLGTSPYFLPDQS